MFSGKGQPRLRSRVGGVIFWVCSRNPFALDALSFTCRDADSHTELDGPDLSGLNPFVDRGPRDLQIFRELLDAYKKLKRANDNENITTVINFTFGI